MIPVAEAERLILDAVPRAPAIEVPLQAAQGEILREAVTADRPFPPYDRVAMDGIALALDAHGQAPHALPVEGVQRAGEPPRRLSDRAHCLEVMTGAVLPEGCNCVVPVEQLTLRDGVAFLRDDLDLQPMQNVHVRGSDRLAGAELMSEGAVMHGPQCAVAASVGRARLRIAVRPAIALASTGDELVKVAATPLAHQVRRSNVYALEAALAQAGFRDVQANHVPDDPGMMERVLADRLADSRFLILSGGVSEGRFDHVPAVLSRLGVREVFHKVSQRPGKPLWFGLGRDGQAVFGLPGNPVSSVVCLVRYVLPALWTHLGARVRAVEDRPTARLAEASPFRKPMTLFLPVRVEQDAQGPVGRAVPMNGSGDLAGLATSDGLLELAPSATGHPPGGLHPLWLWRDPWGILDGSDAK